MTLIIQEMQLMNLLQNLKQYHLMSILFALGASLAGLTLSYHLGASTGAAISLCLALVFAVTFVFGKKK